MELVPSLIIGGFVLAAMVAFALFRNRKRVADHPTISVRENRLKRFFDHATPPLAQAVAEGSAD